MLNLLLQGLSFLVFLFYIGDIHEYSDEADRFAAGIKLYVADVPDPSDLPVGSAYTVLLVPFIWSSDYISRKLLDKCAIFRNYMFKKQ